MEVNVLNIKGEDTGRKVTLNESIFGIEPNDHAIYLDVKQFMANQRQGTHKSKERSEISGSTRKLGRQKGGGGARRGDIILIIAFAYFYTSITFNPLEIANNMKKAGGFIPGIRPGKPTSDYLNKILNYIVFIGAVGLAFVAFIPIFFNGVFNADVSFGGTSIIIIVGVIIETLKQIESQMRVRYYKGFLND